MQEKHLYEYAVIRVVPSVEREEFVNAGVILFCSSKRFLEILYNVDKVRLERFSCKIDLGEVEERLTAFHKVCCGKKDGGPIGQLALASRFRWLTAARSTVVQTSAVHPGLCDDPKQTLTKLYEQLVL